MDDHEAKLLDLLPSDHSRQVDSWHYISRLPEFCSDFATPVRVLDLGAGAGRSRNRFLTAFSETGCNWSGVDIADSPEVLAREDSDSGIHFYDGVSLPFESSSFDVIWCRQVLEHVRHPDKVISEVSRCLSDNGIFVGSVSQMEPYHSHSIFNWTHYGIRVVFETHGLEVKELRPGVDGMLLMLRTLFGKRTPLNNFFKSEAPLSYFLQHFEDQSGKSRSTLVKRANFRKMMVAGHIHFLARKSTT